MPRRPAVRRRPVPLAVRYWSKVDKRGPDQCWPWLGTTTKGYGMIRGVAPGSGRAPVMLAHRVAFEIAHGRPPAPGLDILHSCDNPPCQNPAHHFEGTHTVNMSDMTSKGRRASVAGERNPAAKLTAAQVVEVRALAGAESQSAIARRFGVTQTAIWRIVHGKSWRHIVKNLGK